MDSLQNDSKATAGPRLKAPKKEAARSNRFGFRQANTVRPASVGPLPKHADLDGETGGTITRTNHERSVEENVVNNNNNTTTTNSVGGDAAKRRSKSASASTRNSVTFNETVMVQPVKKTPQSSRRMPPLSGHYHVYREQGSRTDNSGLHTRLVIQSITKFKQ